MANESLGFDIPRSFFRSTADKVCMVMDSVARVNYAKSWKPVERGTHSEFSLFCHNVLLGRYFNVDSNKPSNKK